MNQPVGSESVNVNENDFDAIVAKFAAGNGGGSDNGMMPMLFMMMKSERDDRKASSQNMMNMLMSLLPVIIPMFAAKGPDPLMLEMIRGMMSGKDQTEQFKQMLELQRQNTASSIDQLKTMFVSMMEQKDKINEEALRRASENDGGGKSTAVEVLREIRLGVAQLAMAPTPPGMAAVEQPGEKSSSAAPAEAAPALLHNPGSTAAPKVAKDVVPQTLLILRQLKKIQENPGHEKQAEWRAILVAMTLRDEDMLDILMSDNDTPEQMQENQIKLVDHCTPFITTNPDVMGWAKKEGVAAWLSTFVNKKLIPMLADALDEDDDSTDETKTPPAVASGSPAV